MRDVRRVVPRLSHLSPLIFFFITIKRISDSYAGRVCYCIGQFIDTIILLLMSFIALPFPFAPQSSPTFPLSDPSLLPVSPLSDPLKLQLREEHQERYERIKTWRESQDDPNFTEVSPQWRRRFWHKRRVRSQKEPSE